MNLGDEENQRLSAEGNAVCSPILVTGGAGFIGSNFILHMLRETERPIINLDKLTYAANPQNLASITNDRRYSFVHADICDRRLVCELLEQTKPMAIVHFAAESHVDRSIVAPDAFVHTNVQGTFVLLEQARRYWLNLSKQLKGEFRFLHVSTDEVFGSLAMLDAAFTEERAYAPNSPYSASKAASDHLVRAYHHTYGLPTLTTNCSNNYGPFQFPEKLIPLIITRAMEGKKLPVYGDGLNVRDWLFVEDHCRALTAVLSKGNAGETYNIGGQNEMANLDVVKHICSILDELAPPRNAPRYELIEFVKDRAGHDRRYAIDATKVRRHTGWEPVETFATGIRKTVIWYLENQHWVQSVSSGAYAEWLDSQYANRSE